MSAVIRRMQLLVPCLCQSSVTSLAAPCRAASTTGYTTRTNETLEVQRARLLYQSRKRGMLENDLVLSTFAAKYLNTFTEEQLQKYDMLINLPSNDWDIYHWATGKKEAPLELQNEILDLLKAHVKNEKREKRFHQPALHTS
ncbi:succinate dehydrogenase assembly factor 2, mitochondrial-like [Ornithodoros turicata]|uniref:succinate dehydrogenase assembly factor 2, mitochondrial-like n=1 Tax=Ornithodoros turicata TaxID=34597 RepID=UPI00313891A3